MGMDLTKYFTDELSLEEKQAMLSEINGNEELREEFLKNQNMVSLLDWILLEGDEELAQRKLSEFMRDKEERRNT
ncbi:anti-sigma factor [Bacteroides sp.]|uniref:anti-sigma factor n=1 Tax=Bacteroides sp. TaxID=29523 RepID=UPI002633F05D|nr:anti-sigma factor [Bacteroides sp.]MDD3036629.1 anti-sigma factor [Bacteroides sp.]